MEQLTSGFRDLGRGLAVLRAHPRLWKWVIAPAAITLVVFGGLVAGVWLLTAPVATLLGAHLPGALSRVASSIATVVVAVALSAAALSVFVSIAGLISGPFMELLSERVEAILTARPLAPFSLREFAHGALLGAVHAIRRVLASLVALALVFALGFIPVIGTAAAVALAAWVAATGAAYDCYDAVLARRLLGYRHKLDYLARHRLRTVGLGAAVAGMLLVPGLNLVALGLGAAGATVAAHEIETAPRRDGQRPLRIS